MEWYNFKNNEPANLQEVRVKRIVDNVSCGSYTEQKIILFDAVYFVHPDNNKFWIVYKTNKLEGWVIDENDIWYPKDQ